MKSKSAAWSRARRKWQLRPARRHQDFRPRMTVAASRNRRRSSCNVTGDSWPIASLNPRFGFAVLLGETSLFGMFVERNSTNNDKRDLDDAQSRYVASSASLATALAGTRGGVGVLVDTPAVSLYCALIGRSARTCRGKLVYPFS